MIRKILAVILIILLFSLSFTEPTIAAETDLESRIQKYTLANGIRVLMLERRISPTVSLYIRQLTGAVDEISGKTGAAHFLEHMLFKGTTTIGARDMVRERRILKKIRETGNRLDEERLKAEKADNKLIEKLTAELKALQDKHNELFIPNELDRIYTQNGAEAMNAGTGQDMTTYFVSLPANRIELWARIESDRMQNPVFREFYSERDVIMEERRQRIETNPGGKLSEQFFAAAFTAHPYGRPIIGWPSDMSFLNKDDLDAFFEKARAPRHTVIAVVGDINAKETLAIIRKYFENIPNPPHLPTFISEEPPQVGERRVEVVFDAKPQLMMGYHKPQPPAHDDYVMDVIDAILSRGRTSRFYRNLVEGRKLADRVTTANGMPGARYPNLFFISASPRRPHDCRELETAIMEELEKLKTEAVSAQELQKVKNLLKFEFFSGLDSNNRLASMLSYYEALLGDYRYLPNYMKVIDKISPADIMQAANKYFKNENKTTATLVSKHPETKQ